MPASAPDFLRGDPEFIEIVEKTFVPVALRL